MTDEELIKSPEAIRRMEYFFNENREPVDSATDGAVFKNVYLYDDKGELEESYSVDIIDGVDQEYVEAKEEAEEEFKEGDRERIPKGEPNAGQWVGDNTSTSDLKNELQKNIEPTEKETKIQTKIDVDVRARIEAKIIELELTDKVDYVETQGSYIKGTDLPSKGSDMDIFVVFKSDVPEEERKELGLKIGMAVMTPEYAESQGWDNFKVDEKDSANKYAEAFFDVDGQTVEVQIVPTRNMDKYDIIKKELNGVKTDIGMERTPHQTKFMNENLTDEQKLEVRTLKKFMKETGLYDSSVKSQGFSGYSTEVLIYNLGSFDKVVDFLADYKMGDVVGVPNETEIKDLSDHGVQTEGKYTKEWYNTQESFKNNKIHMTDPVDPNRDIGGAISEAKLAKTILTMQYVREHGKAPDRIEPTSMNGVSLTFTSKETDENTVGSQVQKLQKNMISSLSKLGFNVEKEFDEPRDIVDGLSVNPNRTSIDQEKGSNEMTINFGMKELLNNKEETKTKDISKMPEKAVQGMTKGLDAKGTRYDYDKEKGTITTYNTRQFTNVQDAVSELLKGQVKGVALEDSALLREIREQNIDPFTKISNFENIV